MSIEEKIENLLADSKPVTPEQMERLRLAGIGCNATKEDKPSWAEMGRLAEERDKAQSALADLWEQYEDRKAQWGGEYLWEKHEDPDVISRVMDALPKKSPETFANNLFEKTERNLA